MQELVATPLDKLVEIPGIGEKTAEKVLATALEYVAAHPPAAVAGGETGELEFTPEMESGDGPVAGADATSDRPEADATAPSDAAEGEPHAQ